MNRHCHGTEFGYNENTYWRCLKDGTISQFPVGDTCPSCDRERSVSDKVKQAKTRIITRVEVYMPALEQWVKFWEVTQGDYDNPDRVD